MRLLIVEDDLRLAGLLRRGLIKERLAVDLVANGEDALWMAPAHEFDAIVLDVMLPGIDGFETCRRLRTAGVWTPVLILTARDSVEDRVVGLDTGADDYLVKPFAFAELLARLRALARRGEPERPSVLVAGGLRLDPATRQVWRGTAEIALSAKLICAFGRRIYRRSSGSRARRSRLLAPLLWNAARVTRNSSTRAGVLSMRHGCSAAHPF